MPFTRRSPIVLEAALRGYVEFRGAVPDVLLLRDGEQWTAGTTSVLAITRVQADDFIEIEDTDRPPRQRFVAGPYTRFEPVPFVLPPRHMLRVRRHCPSGNGDLGPLPSPVRLDVVHVLVNDGQG